MILYLPPSLGKPDHKHSELVYFHNLGLSGTKENITTGKFNILISLAGYPWALTIWMERPILPKDNSGLEQ